MLRGQIPPVFTSEGDFSKNKQKCAEESNPHRNTVVLRLEHLQRPQGEADGKCHLPDGTTEVSLLSQHVWREGCIPNRPPPAQNSLAGGPQNTL